MTRSLTHKLLAVALAGNYFSFQIEPFEEEYEANHPALPETCAFAGPAVTWETFDKQNAPKAFVFDAGLRIQFLSLISSQPTKELPSNTPYQPVRDKSPPGS